jgi:5-methylthioadenosine/S-adenosylhomocysteine deaminase
MATIEGARAVHLEKEIGSLEAGKKADIILIDLDKPNAVPIYDVYAALAYALKGSDVRTVIIGGKIVMRDRKLLTINEDQVLTKAREYKTTVAKSLEMQ